MCLSAARSNGSTTSPTTRTSTPTTRVQNNDYHNDTFASRFGWAFGRNTALSATVRHMNSSYGSPNGIELYGIADDSSSEC